MGNPTVNVSKGPQGVKKNKFKGMQKPVEHTQSNPRLLAE